MRSLINMLFKLCFILLLCSCSKTLELKEKSNSEITTSNLHELLTDINFDWKDTISFTSGNQATDSTKKTIEPSTINLFNDYKAMDCNVKTRSFSKSTFEIELRSAVCN